ncbi:hypothetical protein ABLE93_24855 [Xanthobacter sp. KR7-65]|uniref:hypothetical protein n=1 Tax=Xanthobacter sp. KR7-65 TaxID=3156612 RepID=UPI0032B5779D
MTAARSTAARYRNAPEVRDAYAARKRSHDIERLNALERIVAAEKVAAGIAANYTAKRDPSGYVLKRNGVEFGRLIGSARSLTFTSPDTALAERVCSTVVAWGGILAALATVRAADEALRLARANRTHGVG